MVKYMLNDMILKNLLSIFFVLILFSVCALFTDEYQANQRKVIAYLLEDLQLPEDAEIVKEVEDIVSTINDKNKENALEINKEPVIVYENLQEMYNDHNKFILKSPDKDISPYEYLYSIMVTNFKYNESLEKFIIKLKKILDCLDLNSESHKDIFEDNDIRINLLQEIVNNKVMNGEYCYVKSEKLYYIYNENEGKK